MKLDKTNYKPSGYIGYCTAPSQENDKGLVAIMRSHLSRNTDKHGFGYIDRNCRPNTEYHKVFCGKTRKEAVLKAVHANRDVHRFETLEEFTNFFFNGKMQNPKCCANAETLEAILVLENEGKFIQKFKDNNGIVDAKWIRNWWATYVRSYSVNHLYKIDFEHVHYELMKQFKQRQLEAKRSDHAKALKLAQGYGASSEAFARYCQQDINLPHEAIDGDGRTRSGISDDTFDAMVYGHQWSPDTVKRLQQSQSRMHRQGLPSTQVHDETIVSMDIETLPFVTDLTHCERRFWSTQFFNKTGENAMSENNTFTTRHFLGDDNLDNMTDRQVIGRIKSIENEIGVLEGMQAKSTKRDKMIKRMKKDIRKALRIVDSRKSQ